MSEIQKGRSVEQKKLHSLKVGLNYWLKKQSKENKEYSDKLNDIKDKIKTLNEQISSISDISHVYKNANQNKMASSEVENTNNNINANAKIVLTIQVQKKGLGDTDI